ncbi:hypothetical protein AB0M28_14720 [Streptomyces sp. NPDC051940]|uniref:hypothetical protein n=1 Tax=Streptomyces sp. NPDC051940 TaxID=3155675 RepID=UPI00343753D8
MTRWGLIVEETTGSGEAARWTPRVLAVVDGGRGEALARLERFARQYQPQHPMMPKQRWLFETADGFLLFLEGRRSEYHCRFSAVELVCDSTGYERPSGPQDAPPHRG